MNRLDRRHILVTEDDPLISTLLCGALERLGATIVGPAADLASGLFLAENTPRIDAGILDVNLGTDFVYPVADALMARSVPFVLATGCAVFHMPVPLWNMPRQDKPYCADDLARRVAAMCAVSDEGTLPAFIAQTHPRDLAAAAE
jgi:DNA-binding NarL/FixJ family response regulator